MSGIQLMMLGKTVTPTVTGDNQFNKTTLLLPGNGTSGAQNNTFIDSSTNAFTITRNGNPTQGSNNPFVLSAGYWSVYFNSSSITRPSGLQTAFAGWGGRTRTWESWVYRSDSSDRSFQCAYDGVASDGRWYIEIQSNKLRFGWTTSTSTETYIDSTNDIPVGQWTHLAVCVNSSTSTNTTIYLCIDGVVKSSTGNNLSTQTSTFGWQNMFGGASYQPSAFLGYASNLRWSNNVRYTANFTPPTSPFTSDANTLFLGCSTNRFIDTTSNAYTVAPSSDSTTVQAFSPFLVPTSAYSTSTNGGTGYFDGSGDYITASNASLALGSSDFSIEWWEYRSTVGSEDTPISTGNYTSAYAACLLGYSGGVGGVSTNGSSWNVFNFPSYVNTVYANNWNHFVYTRSGTAFRVFMNGKLSNYTTASGSVVQNSNQFNIGGNSGSSNYDYPGYISNVRVVIGSIPTTYQTASTTTGTQIFTSPTAPLTTTSQGATSGDVKLLCNFVNAGIYDATMKNDLETIGNAQISTTQAQWSGSSMAFDGTGDYLTVINSPNLLLYAKDFTIDGWFYLTSINTAYGIISKGTASTGWSVNVTSGNKLQFSYTSSNLTGATSLAAGTWYYFAVVRSGSGTGNLKVYLNGSADATSAGAVTDTFDQTNVLYVGADRTAGSALNGYLQDIRITKGYARTVTTVPTAPLPLYGA